MITEMDFPTPLPLTALVYSALLSDLRASIETHAQIVMFEIPWLCQLVCAVLEVVKHTRRTC